MPTVNMIRDLHRRGESNSAIARMLGIDRKTVRKYIEADDFSPKPPAKRKQGSVLDPYKETVDGWLEEDRHVFKKQRHTAKRIFDRLVDEHGYPGSYCPVQRYVKQQKAEMVTARPVDEPLDLVWEPGSMQADFGQADFDFPSERRRMHHLTASYPHSNAGFTQVFGGEAAECVCQGLKDIFEYTGSVPHTIVFDNASGAGKRIREVVIETELFSRFRAHYGFEVRFCNPESGWEKGSVERKVSYHRRNLFVPVPAVVDVVAFNKGLLDRCLELEAREHYRKELPIHRLLAEDLKNSLPLPEKPFNCVRYTHVKTDGYGYVTLDGCHTYSSSPSLSRTEVAVAIRAHTVEVIDPDGVVVAAHSRQFGRHRTESIDVASTVRLLSRKPGAWLNSQLRAMMPEAVVSRMDAMGREEPKEDLRLLADSIERSGMEATFDALDVLAQEHEDFPDFFQVGVLAARIADLGIAAAPEPGGDLGAYDELFLDAGVRL